MNRYYTGFDIGTDCVTAIVMSEDFKIVFAPEPLFHFGNPIHALKDIFHDITSKFDFHSILSTSFTGSGGEHIACQLETPFFHDTITIPAGIGIIAPEAGYVFHIGARDSYFFEIERVKTETGFLNFVSDHGTGTKCGGGSGLLITKQCRRFFENGNALIVSDNPKENRRILRDKLKQIYRDAENSILSSDKKIDVGGRCGVVIQSDMIHLQNSGEQINNILSGLYDRVIKNFKSDVIKTRNFDAGLKAIATGGIFESTHLVHTLEKEVNLDIAVPDYFRFTGAIGAVVKANRDIRKFTPEQLDHIADSEIKSIKTVPALKHSLKNVRIYDEELPDINEKDLLIYDFKKSGKTDVIIGIDGGSTTTKAVVTHAESLKIIAQICLYTNGKPLETVQEIFRKINKAIGDYIEIKAVAYTGSSGAFYHRLFTANGNHSKAKPIDLVKDEITCHAYGVKHFDTKTDTIFELGGQDAKFTLFNPDGTVKKSRMNLSCMAGTGQTMQNMVEMIGLDINSTFHEFALSAEKTPVVDDTCGVFTEAGIAKLISLGFPKEEVAAAIAYGFMGGYVNKFIGNETYGEFASAQGGPFNGKAPLAALAMHTGMKIHAFPHRQLFGALGAAISVHKEMKKLKDENTLFECRFRGLGAADLEFTKQENNCGATLSNSCGVKDCRLSIYQAGKENILTGGACPKGNTGTSVKQAPDYVSKYKKILDYHLSLRTSDLRVESSAERILIPRSLTFLNEKGVFYTAFYKSLGFDVALSPESDDEIAELGLSFSHSETCYPVKLAHGHAAFLKKHLNPGRDKILLISTIGSGKEKYKFCPYVSGSGFILKDALDIPNIDALLPVVYFDDPNYPLEKSLYNDLKRVYGSRFRMKHIRNALRTAFSAEKNFLREIYGTGDQLFKRLIGKNEKIFIGLGRGYTLFDNKASSKVHELFASNGLHFLPSFFLKPPEYDISNISENMYWVQGRNIIQYNIETAIKPNFFPVRATNFNCGSDSILLFHEEKIIQKSQKPHLVLQTDGHSSNAQFGTRTLANYEVVKNFSAKPLTHSDFLTTYPPVVLKNKIIGIPFMGDHSHILAATFRALGFQSEVMPTRTKIAREIAAKNAGSNICMPFSFQVGDTLAWLNALKEKNIDPNKKAVVLEPMAKGPCRFGQYHVLLKKIFIDNGYDKVDILTPDADSDYANLPMTDSDIMSQAMDLFKGIFCLDVIHDALLRTRPYEKVKGSTKKLYNTLFKNLTGHIESKNSTKVLVSFMEKANKEYEKLIDPKIKRKPVIAVTGEIFVRLNPVANSYSLELLEKYGLETRLTPLSQWMEYANKSSIQQFKLASLWKNYAKAILKKNYMRTRAEKLYAPFKGFLKGREHHESCQVIDYIQKDLVYDKNIQGESPLSIGEAYMFAKGKFPDISGIYHVSPFGCMQETAATSQIQSITRQQRNSALHINDKIIPLMDAVFGDSELSNLEAEIAVFSEKCYIKSKLSGNDLE